MRLALGIALLPLVLALQTPHNGHSNIFSRLLDILYDRLSPDEKYFGPIDETNDSERPRNVAIIGAGFAGLSAARRLRQFGVNCTVFEGLDRAGGRAWSVPHPDNASWNVQVGATYLNGIDNEIFEIATRLGLVEKASEFPDWTDERQKYACGEGCEVNSEHLSFFSNFTSSLEQKYLELSWERPLATFADVIGEDVERLKKTPEYQSSPAVFDGLVKLYRSYYETEYSGPAETLGIYNLAVWDNAINDVTQWDMNQVGMTGIVNDAKKDIAIRFNHTVWNINYTGQRSFLHFTNGETSEAFDYVIVTSSLGHLKKHHSALFTPRLPAWKTDAIEAMGYGNMMKVVLFYGQPWYEEDMAMFNSWIGEKEQQEEQVRSNLPLFDNLRQFEPVSWDTRFLVCWLSSTGPAAASNMDDSQLSTAITNHLRWATNNQSIPEPDRIIRLDWHSHPLFLGSYSYLTPAAVRMGDAAERLARPIEDRHRIPRVQFAGEACSERMYQTVTGAWESGREEADRVVKEEVLSGRVHVDLGKSAAHSAHPGK